jgi:hypothetical protein
MKWLPTTLILFSVGIICVIAETAGAKPESVGIAGKYLQQN